MFHCGPIFIYVCGKIHIRTSWLNFSAIAEINFTARMFNILPLVCKFVSDGLLTRLMTNAEIIIPGKNQEISQKCPPI